MSWDPIDLEDIHKLAKQHEFCPYYVSKDRVGGADIIFMPYNYLIDEKIRKSMIIDWSKSIIIFDEAHNIAQATEDVTSFDLKEETLQASEKEIDQLMAAMKNNCYSDK